MSYKAVSEMMAVQRETVGLDVGGDTMKARVHNGPEVKADPFLGPSCDRLGP